MNSLTDQALFADIRNLIDNPKNTVAVKVNQEMTLLYWNIGKHIQASILRSK